MKKRIDYMLYEKKKEKGTFHVIMTGIFVLSVSLLVSCGYKGKEERESDLAGTEKESLSADSLRETSDVSDSVRIHTKEIEEEKYETAKRGADFCIAVTSVNTVIDTFSYTTYGLKQEQNPVLADFGEECIILSEASGERVLNEIVIPNDRYRLFINMTDENNGYLLYCGTPAAGLMKKILYITKDRWKTYSEIDISSEIDGYPNSFSAVSEDKIYIGTQMRSNGYLFASEDEGKSWEAAWVDGDTYFKYGYAPLFDEESRRAYLILEIRDDYSSGAYILYQAEYPAADSGDSWNLAWESTGKFILEDYSTIEEYFLYEGQIYLMDSQGKQYQIALD